MPSAQEKLTYNAYRGAAWLGETLPPKAGIRLAKGAAHVARWVMPERNRMAERHQRRVRPDATDAEIARSLRGVWDSYARYWWEMFRLPAEVRAGRIVEHFRCSGYEHVEAALAEGRGAVFALPHLGGWEWGAAWMAAAPRSQHMLAVAEALEPPQLLEWFVRLRESMGLEIAPVGPDVSARVIGALRANRIVCLLSDRDVTGGGVEVEFFGERTLLPAGPATMSLRTGAALLPAAVYFAPDIGHRTVIRPAVPVERRGRLKEDVARITQALAREFEVLIGDAPEQWHLLQPNWPSDRRQDAGAPPVQPGPPSEPSVAVTAGDEDADGDGR